MQGEPDKVSATKWSVFAQGVFLGLIGVFAIFALVALPFSGRDAGAGAGFAMPAILSLFVIGQIIAILVLASVNPARGAGYLLGTLIFIPGAFVWLKGSEYLERRASDATRAAFASRELPQFSKPHGILEYPELNTHEPWLPAPWRDVALKTDLIVQSGYHAAAASIPRRAFKGGMGPECWAHQNIAQTKRLIQEKLHSGRETDRCILEVPHSTTADAMFILDDENRDGTLAAYGFPPSNRPSNVRFALVGERISGKAKIITKVVMTGGYLMSAARPRYTPSTPACDAAYSLKFAATCLATGVVSSTLKAD